MYDIEYDPRGYTSVASSEHQNDMSKYADAVENSLWPALKRAKGMKFPRFGEYKDVVVEDIVLLPRARVLLDDYQIKLAFGGKDKEGKTKKWEQIIPVVDLFTKGGMLNRDDARMYISKYRNVDNAVNLIMTRKNSVGKSDTGTSRIKLDYQQPPVRFPPRFSWSEVDFVHGIQGVQELRYEPLAPHVHELGIVHCVPCF